MPKRPKHGPVPNGVSITGQRKARQSSLVPLSVEKEKDDVLESYEQTVEPSGPDSVGTGTPDGELPPPVRATPD